MSSRMERGGNDRHADQRGVIASHSRAGPRVFFAHTVGDLLRVPEEDALVGVYAAPDDEGNISTITNELVRFREKRLAGKRSIVAALLFPDIVSPYQLAPYIRAAADQGIGWFQVSPIAGLHPNRDEAASWQRIADALHVLIVGTAADHDDFNVAGRVSAAEIGRAVAPDWKALDKLARTKLDELPDDPDIDEEYYR